MCRPQNGNLIIAVGKEDSRSLSCSLLEPATRRLHDRPEAFSTQMLSITQHLASIHAHKLAHNTKHFRSVEGFGADMQTRNGNLEFADHVQSTRHARHLGTTAGMRGLGSRGGTQRESPQ
jgi:hypothetical protein